MDKLTYERASEIVDATYPGGVEKFRQDLAQEIWRAACEYEVTHRWIRIFATREGTDITIKWKSIDKRALDYSTHLQVGLVELEPNRNPPIIRNYAPKTNGDGMAKLTLKEGRTYYFMLHFFLSDDDVKSTGLREKFGVTFSMNIPLTAEHLEQFDKKILKPERDPQERIKDAVTTMLDCEDTFDEMLKIGTRRIKAKRLPKNEEKDRIEELRENLALMKEEFAK